jgi:Transcriptional regulators
VLYFVGRNPGCSVNELLSIMRVSKQYLNRPLRQLVEDGYIESKRDARDRRVKRLKLTAKGRRLEETLTGEQRSQLAEVFRKAGPRAEAGWRKVMALLAGENG